MFGAAIISPYELNTIAMAIALPVVVAVDEFAGVYPNAVVTSELVSCGTAPTSIQTPE